VSRSAGVEKSKNKSASGCDPCCGKDPAKEASGWQGPKNKNYPEQDTYRNTVLKKGSVILALHPYTKLGNYFSDSRTLLAAGGSARKYNDSLQLRHASNTPGTWPMRNDVEAFIVQEDICVAKGLAEKNDRYGAGGGTQYYVLDSDKSKLLPSYKIKLSKP
jgi:hypothetical protein